MLFQNISKLPKKNQNFITSPTISDTNLTLDWLQDKIQRKFVFPAICWEQSLIPFEVWNAGDSTSNLIESVHADVNQGVGCTLIGGVKKGWAFDTMKMTSLKVFRILQNFDC